MDEIQKKCRNCGYFCEHYFIYRNCLRTTGSGNCVHAKTDCRKRRRLITDEGCENWQPENRKAERTEQIDKTIRDISQTLKQILMILKTE